jgi:small subunit ribosomal protein S20
MPNMLSAKKRVRQTVKRNAQNSSRTTALKTAIKKVMLALEERNVETAKLLLRDAESKIMSAKTKHVLHRNTAVRTVSRLARRVAQAARQEITA